MATYIALFRGINVGGNNKLPMKQLTALLESLGLQSVQTYIQSGNVVFEAPDRRRDVLAGEISSAVSAACGFEPEVLLLTIAELEEIRRENPFPEGEAEPKTLHVFVLAGPPTTPDLPGIEALRRPSERVSILGSRVYLHAPEGIGTSKLASKLERLVGVPATARNWNTVVHLADLARSPSE